MENNAYTILVICSYNKLINIKSAKFRNVQNLASKYVPAKYIGFYITLVEETSNKVGNGSDDEE